MTAGDQRRDVIARLRTAGCVFAEDEADLLLAAADSDESLWSLVERRTAGLPLEYLLGWAEFCGFRVSVIPPVFVPRKRTEFLARQAVAAIRPGATVLELCCGTGAISLVLARSVAPLELHASDIDPSAVRCARRNLELTGATVYEGDLYDPLPETLRARVDLLVVNAPYVPSAAIAYMPPEAREHEALIALDGGEDGLVLHRRIAAEATTWLRPGGRLMIETSQEQAATAVQIFATAGLIPRVERDDELEATAVSGYFDAGAPPTPSV
ncbi:putative protein N(5)-glutamine methyltransferase [Jatrophihabitans telluris]|uniref:peptide chain release factor N(5)-glutamine methyltransferase n=1 Tax=Jatrophihabitans telluris TaxID=2038343 RepID=A0ABY4QU66_9ACTN|nr:putative protein N(5)-glutamine methyltransferase [Jatrophihabitans telluris]UQX86677.1 putative protein N(5)-glutamine methyltransferase [Jatrophihabitans telluris]